MRNLPSLSRRLMGEYQLGIQLTDAQIASIVTCVTWLRTLKGELLASYVERPNLPADGQYTLPPAPAQPPGQ